MTDATHALDALPSPDDVDAYRAEAKEQDTDVVVEFPTDDGKRELVVSPRGTCVVVGDNVTRNALHPDAAAADVVAALTK